MSAPAADEVFDAIVVGGGTAGAVVAARLSEDPRRRVLLLEAGPDHACIEDLPPPLHSARGPVMAGFNWPRMAALGPPGAAARPSFPYPVGKVMGGSSATNAAIALRPLPQDFAAWAAAAGDEWAWDQVLPVFRCLENDLDCGGPAHGDAGPIPVQRPRRLAPLQQAFHDACRQAGLPPLPDLNDGSAHSGIGLLPANSRGGLRISSAVAYRMPARGRANLVVRGHHTVQRVLFDQRQHAIGVQALPPGGSLRTLHAGLVVLCAGAIHTPALLLRSGIGPADACRARTGRCVADLPGVGAGLMDHAAVTLWLLPREGRGPDAEPDDPALAQHQVLARLDAGGEAAALGLLPVTSVDITSRPTLAALLGARRAHALSVLLARPLSRGRVDLDDSGEARVALNIGAEPKDVAGLAAGVRHAWALARSAALASEVRGIALWSEADLTRDDLLQAAVRRWATGTWHAAGTARMGRADDPGAVVDAHGRVRGVPGLVVADASVMPALPSTPTQLACLMLAERIAGWLRREG